MSLLGILVAEISLRTVEVILSKYWKFNVFRPKYRYSGSPDGSLKIDQDYSGSLH